MSRQGGWRLGSDAWSAGGVFAVLLIAAALVLAVPMATTDRSPDPSGTAPSSSVVGTTQRWFGEATIK
jgi:hypothetical protein